MLPGLQRLSYAGKNFEDSARTLDQCVPASPIAQREYRAAYRQLRSGAHARPPRRYGVAYWHKKFPHWPIIIRRH